MARPRLLRLPFLLLLSVSFWLGAARPCLAAEKTSDDDASSAKNDESSDSDAPKKEAKSAPAEKADDKEKGLGHMGQFGLRANLVLGYRMILRYSDSPFCAAPDGGPADSQQTFCGHAAPIATDLALSFGVLDFLEPFAWARLGLRPEHQTDTNALVVLGGGVRLYTMSDAAFKIFIEPSFGFELESGRGTPAWQLNSPQYKKDLLFRIAAGPEFDIMRNVGIYATGGLSASFIRAFAASLDLSFGLQGRL